MANQKNLITGILDIVVLSILSQEDTYAYALCKKITALSNDKLSVTLSSIYTVIYKLERAKYITEYSVVVGKKRTRVYYHLEPSGHEYAHQMLTEYFHITDSVACILHSLNLIKEEPSHE